MRAWVVPGVVSGMCAGVFPVPQDAVAASAPVSAQVADLAFHGVAQLDGDVVEVRLTPRNSGPAAVPDASVRLRWSVPPAEAQRLPARCAREDERTVVCATGALAVGEAGKRLRVPVRLKERPSEVMLEIETAWSGGTVDKDRANDRLKVLVPDTGDAYAF